jgi:autotransporter-associated beta strand protein/T5SS/PEP-CTERM-associated repeat protein
VSGGSVTNTTGVLGYNNGSVGTATVSSGTWANSGDLTVGVSGTGTLTMSGGLVSVAGTLSQGTYGTINLNSGGTLQIGVGGTTGDLNVSTLTNNGTLIFNRSDAATYSGIISGTGAVTKQGGGTLTFSGTSSYTGATRVDGGRLLVNGQLGNTAVAVNASGLLGGSGTILGDVTVGSSGTLSPGNSPGVLTVESLSLLAGSTTLMEITGTSASLYDQVVGNGSGGLTYGGTLDLVMSGSYANGTTFNLFSNFSSPSIGDFAAVGLDATGSEYAGLTFTGTAGVWTSTWTTNHQRLVFSTGTGDLVVVPEPSTYALMAIGAGIVGLMHRRKRRTATATTTATVAV